MLDLTRTQLPGVISQPNLTTSTNRSQAQGADRVDNQNKAQPREVAALDSSEQEGSLLHIEGAPGYVRADGGDLPRLSDFTSASKLAISIRDQFQQLPADALPIQARVSNSLAVSLLK